MKNIQKPILLLFLIPLVSIFLSIFYEHGFQKNWETYLTEEIGAEESKNLLYFDLEKFCKSSDVQDQTLIDFCEYPRYSYYIRDLSIFFLALGLLLILFIAIAGKIAMNHRIFLLKIFKPGLYITLFTLSILILGLSFLSITILYFLESYILGMIHFQILAVIGIGALVGAYQILKSIFSIVNTNQIHVAGTAYDTYELGNLSKLIEEVSEMCQSFSPDNVILGFDPTFFVTEGNVLCRNKTTRGTSLYISLPLCRILSINELKAILAHEFSHFTGEDTSFSKEFYPIYKGTFDSLQIIQDQINSHSYSFSYYPVAYILDYFFQSFALAENNIRRSRELRADTIASETMGNQNFGMALVKIYAYSELWEQINDEMYSKIKNNERVTNASESFQNFILQKNTPNLSIEEIEKNSDFHPTDTHPPLKERLLNVSLDLETILPQINLDLNSNLSVKLIPGYESIEMELTESMNENFQEYYELYEKEKLK